MGEIKNLRKALSPQSDQVFAELQKLDETRKKQEDELISLYMQKDELKVSIFFF